MAGRRWGVTGLEGVGAVGRLAGGVGCGVVGESV